MSLKPSRKIISRVLHIVIPSIKHLAGLKTISDIKSQKLYVLSWEATTKKRKNKLRKRKCSLKNEKLKEEDKGSRNQDIYHCRKEVRRIPKLIIKTNLFCCTGGRQNKRWRDRSPKKPETMEIIAFLMSLNIIRSLFTINIY